MSKKRTGNNGVVKAKDNSMKEHLKVAHKNIFLDLKIQLCHQQHSKFAEYLSDQIKSFAQSCPILRDPMDCSPPGSSIQGIFQARVLEWGAIAFFDQKATGYTNILGKLV